MIRNCTLSEVIYLYISREMKREEKQGQFKYELELLKMFDLKAMWKKSIKSSNFLVELIFSEM